MIEAVIGAVREYILLKKSKAQVKGIANSDSSTNLLTSSSSSSTMIANAMNPLQAQSTVQNTPSETSYEARKLKVHLKYFIISVMLFFINSRGKEISKLRARHLQETLTTLHISKFPPQQIF